MIRIRSCAHHLLNPHLPVQAREYAGLDVYARDLDGERAMTRGLLGVPRSMQLRDLEEVLACDGSHHKPPRRRLISRPRRKGASGWAGERKATGLWDRMVGDELDD